MHTVLLLHELLCVVSLAERNSKKGANDACKKRVGGVLCRGADRITFRDRKFRGGVEPLGPVPEGYTEESWSKYLESAITTGEVMDLGGVPVVVVELDEPLVVVGQTMESELVGLSADEMASMGVVPGDFSEDSDSEHVKVYYHEEPANDSGSDFAVSDSTSEDLYGDGGSTLSGRSCDAPYYCQLWNDVNGSGLVYTKNSYIQIRSKSATATSARLGTARFHPSVFTYAVQLRFSGDTSFTTITNYYSYGVYNGGVWVWGVYSPDTWVDAGENAWDDIEIRGDLAVHTNNITIDRFAIGHNGYATGDDDPDPDVILNYPGETYDLTPAIDEYREQRMCGVTHDAVEIAMWDLWQGAHIDYPVVPWLSPVYDPYYSPKPWCSEFTSWVYREYDYSTFHSVEHIPEMGELKPASLGGTWQADDTSVFEFFQWAGATEINRRLYFGDDGDSANNGASDVEWELLAFLIPGTPDQRIDAGDYVAMMQCTTSACTGWANHSMIVMGWWNGSDPGGAGCDVDPSYFDPDRMCNQIMTISGNLGGVTGRVLYRGFTVCQRPVWNGVSWVDPPCDIDGDSIVDPEDVCGIRLWDTHLGNFTVSNYEGDFFARMP